jgi:hypothetical protein
MCTKAEVSPVHFRDSPKEGLIQMMLWILMGMVATGALILMVSVHNSRHLSSIVPAARTSKWRFLPLSVRSFFFYGVLIVSGILSLTDQTFYQLKPLNDTVAGCSPLGARHPCHLASHGQPFPCRGDHHSCPIIEIKKTGDSIVVEHVHLNEQGEERIVEVHGYPMHDKTENLIQSIEYALDLSEKKQPENELVQEKHLAEPANADGLVKSQKPNIRAS